MQNYSDIYQVVLDRHYYNILVGKPEGKRALRRRRRRWEDNIRMDLRKIVREGVDWIDLAQVNTVMNLGSIQDGEFLD
jgi:hypothetical protein